MRRSLSMHSIVISLTAALIATNAQAQTPPDACALQQQIERERAAPAVVKPVSGMLISVKKFNFAGNTLIAADQLAPVVRAYLPAQDIKDGVITIQIIEAVFGGTQLEDKAKRVSEKQILRRVEAQRTKGRLLNTDALDRAMLLADDLLGVGGAGALSQGKEDGETDIKRRFLCVYRCTLPKNFMLSA